MKGIDPKYIMWLGLLIYLEKGIGQGAISLTNMIPGSWIPYVLAWSNGLAWMGVGLMTTLAAFSSNATGPLIKVPELPSFTPTIVKILLIAFLPLAVLAGGGKAEGAPKLKTPSQIKQDVDNFINQPATTVENALTGALSQPMQDLQSFLQSDLEGAAALSVQIPSIQDGNGQACWTMLQGASSVFKAHPIPLTLKVATDMEAARLLVITANKICQNAQCTQVFNELSNSIKTIAPMSMSIPSITSLCSQVPQIAAVAGTPVPVATPPATPVSETVIAPTAAPSLTPSVDAPVATPAPSGSK